MSGAGKKQMKLTPNQIDREDVYAESDIDDEDMVNCEDCRFNGHCATQDHDGDVLGCTDGEIRRL
jgi:hypothetical protein